MSNYTTTIRAATTTSDAFDKICRVSEWWSKDVTGPSASLGDEFTVHFGDTFMKFKISEEEPGRRVVWNVIDCYLQLHSPSEKERKDWNGTEKDWIETKIIWEVSADEDESTIDMTHVGLTPQLARFDDYRVRWDGYIGKSLYGLLSKGKGSPAERQRHSHYTTNGNDQDDRQ